MATATRNYIQQATLAGRLDAMAQSGSSLLSFSEPIAALDPLAFFANARRLTGTANYWARPDDNFVLVGAGAALTLRGSGPERFNQVAESWRKLVQGVTDYNDLKTWGVGPLLMGGFAFDPTQQPKNPQWQSFSDGLMVLPQFMLTQTGDQSFLTCNLLLPSDFATLTREARLNLLDEYAANILMLRTALIRPVTAPFPQKFTFAPNYINVLLADQWQKIVGRATAAIKSGAFQKTVLAREVTATFERPLDAETTLRRLQTSFPTATIFAYARREKCFLGATPERLVQLRAGYVRTAALAGSAPRSSQPDEDYRLGQELLNSPKNLGEHRIVVETIAAQLGAMCDPLIVPDAPRLLQLTNVQHLYTPIEGRLQGKTSLLELVAALHPTPALGGYPRQAALDFIRQNEQLDRGWYAAPVGWLNARGEGDFAAAIRSALLEGNQAHLFAGCGIVADSDPATEYAESQFKLEAIAKAIS